MSTLNRERLPENRQSLVHKLNIDGHKAYMIVGFYPDGRPGELFVTMGKDGSTVGGLMKTISLLTSICLQHGISTEYLRKKFDGMRFSPSGNTTNPNIPEATSIPDYIFKWIDMNQTKK